MPRILTLALTVLALVAFATPATLAEEAAPPCAEQPLDLDALTGTGAAMSEVAIDTPEPLFAQDRPVEQCGRRVCPPGTVCCNASCGICTEPGGVCIQILCENPGDANH